MFTTFNASLAIDSELRKPYYGFDCRMINTFQMIAHNTVSVTDPKNEIRNPTKHRKIRLMTINRGWRCIYSGCNGEAGPLNLDEWKAKRGVSYVASIRPFWDKDYLEVITAAITSAYSNREYRLKFFPARMRSVEYFLCTFRYDRVDHGIVVFDKVISTKSSLRGGWPLLMLDAPWTSPSDSFIDVSPRHRPEAHRRATASKCAFPEALAHQ